MHRTANFAINEHCGRAEITIQADGVERHRRLERIGKPIGL